jgi:hypothetical protein
MISPNRELDLESEQSVGNEVKEVKNPRISSMRRRGTQVGRLSGEARAIASA